MCPPTFHHRQWPDLLSTCKSMSREHQRFRTNACFHDLFSHGKKQPLGTWKVWAAQTSGWWRKSCTTSGAWTGPNIAVKTCKNHMFGSPSAGFVHQDGVYLVETCNDFVSFKHTTSVPKYSINKVWWLTKKLLEELAKALNQVVVAVVFTKRGNVCLMTSSSMHLQGLRLMYPWKKHHRKRLKTNHGAASTSTTWVNLMFFFWKVGSFWKDSQEFLYYPEIRNLWHFQPQKLSQARWHVAIIKSCSTMKAVFLAWRMNLKQVAKSWLGFKKLRLFGMLLCNKKHSPIILLLQSKFTRIPSKMDRGQFVTEHVKASSKTREFPHHLSKWNKLLQSNLALARNSWDRYKNSV